MRLTFKEKIISVSILIVTTLLIIVACTDPPGSPFIPDNANMQLLVKSSTGAVGEMAIDSVNRTINIMVITLMPKFIDSISVKIINSSNLTVADSMLRINSSITTFDTILISRNFPLGDRYTVEALAYKENNKTVFESAEIQINGLGNIKPKIGSVGTHNSIPNVACTLSVYGTDTNPGQVLTYTVADAPLTAVFINQQLIWTPSVTDTGTYAIKFKVTDNGLPPLSDSTIHMITMVTNLAKPSKPEDLIVVERKVSSVKLKWNSAKNADRYDVYSVANGGNLFTLRKSIYDTTYTDSVGAVTYRYFVRAHNNAGSISSDTVKVSALNVLNPVWLTDTFTVTISEGMSYKLNLPLLCKVTNDNDLKFNIVTTDLFADSITIQKDYIVTPSYADAGSYSIILAAQQKTLLDTFVISMSVKNVNRAPEFVQNYANNGVFVLVGDTLKVPFSTIDDDGDIVSCSVKNVTLPRSATLELSSLDGIVRWVSAAGDSGSYSFDLIARDSIDSTVVTVKVHVAKGNVGPFWNKKQLAITVKETQACSLDCSIIASDINGDPLTYSLLYALPHNDTIIGNMYRYTPGYNDSGSYKGIKLVVSDKVLSDTALLDLKVINENRKPFIANANDTTVPPNALITFTLSVSDGDGDAVRVLATTLPTGAVFDTITKVFTFKPAEGTHTAIFQASDGIATITKTYIIKASNSAVPNIVTQPVSLIRCEGSSALFFVKATSDAVTNLDYQWRKDGVAINSQTNDSLVILFPALSDSGLYDCVVTNSGASKTSNTAKLTVNSNSVKPTSITASPSAVCVGSIVRLTVSGGKLGTGATVWEWFKDYACTTPLTYSSLTSTASTISITESTTGTKKAYVRAKGTCNETLDSVAYTVAALPSKPSLLTASDSTVNLGDTVTLSAKTLLLIDSKGGVGGLTTVKWYTGGCGGRAIGSGTPLKVVPPAGTTVYYARTENGSCASACDSVSVRASIIKILPIDTLIMAK